MASARLKAKGSARKLRPLLSKVVCMGTQVSKSEARILKLNNLVNGQWMVVAMLEWEVTHTQRGGARIIPELMD